MPIRIGIGVTSGAVIAGYTGTQRRATYTCVGDTVNLAARLESHTKVVGQPILIDGATRQEPTGDIAVEDQGEVQLRGKRQSVHVFSVKCVVKEHRAVVERGERIWAKTLSAG